MRQMLVMGNWKMNGCRSELTTLLQGVAQQVKPLSKVGVAVCPSFVYLDAISVMCEGTSVGLGAQDVSLHEQGAYTGEISAAMLKDLGCQYVLVGHSERRSYHAESNESVARKFVAAQTQGLTPVLCIGETLEERQAGKMQDVVSAQVKAVIEHAGVDAFVKSVIAYEPVWAIGTGVAAEPSDVQNAHGFLRSLLNDYGSKLAQNMQILYGGSVKASNATEILSQPDVDGGLVGGASLKVDEFVAICQAANSE
ncbi:triose-phosphate isomerase [Piscirickettsia litoralis]|uniref:Triosephosphate isomerase n=1 Tax=Piscirickettsia litoralis TaxID=1891921 RepID=A0ABX3A210_9GAMM|nr:triose-phosphate isomerase [Piscirickettsia litoralis]ODN42904.1 triose-phosphate isomerase [Piscirickettsia litoralis]